MHDQVSREDRLLAALCYPFWPLAFLILNLSPVLKRQPFVRYHSFQGFFLGAGIWVGMVVLNTASLLVGRFLWPLGLLMYPLLKLLGLVCLLATAWCSYRAWKGDYLVLPWITDFARPFVEEPLQPREAPAEDPADPDPTVGTAPEEKPRPARRRRDQAEGAASGEAP